MNSFGFTDVVAPEAVLGSDVPRHQSSITLAAEGWLHHGKEELTRLAAQDAASLVDIKGPFDALRLVHDEVCRRSSPADAMKLLLLLQTGEIPAHSDSELEKAIRARTKHANFGVESQQLEGGDPVPAVTAVVFVCSPSRVFWIAEYIDADSAGHGDRVLPPGARGKWSRATLSALVRDVHFRLTAAWLTKHVIASVVRAKDGDEGEGSYALLWFATPFCWPLALVFSMVFDSIMIVLAGTLALLEVIYFVLYHGVATPHQMRQAAAISLHAQSQRGETSGVRYEGVHPSKPTLPFYVMVPQVNSFSVASGFTVSVLAIYVEAVNILYDVDPSDLTTCFTILAVQFGINATVQVALMAAADASDEKQVTSLQRTGSLLHSDGSEHLSRRRAIDAAQELAINRDNTDWCRWITMSLAYSVLPVVSGGVFSFIVALRGRAGFRSSRLSSDDEDNMRGITGMLTSVILLINVVCFDLLRSYIDGRGILFKDIETDLIFVITVTLVFTWVSFATGSVRTWVRYTTPGKAP